MIKTEEQQEGMNNYFWVLSCAKLNFQALPNKIYMYSVFLKKIYPPYLMVYEGQEFISVDDKFNNPL